VANESLGGCRRACYPVRESMTVPEFTEDWQSTADGISIPGGYRWLKFVLYPYAELQGPARSAASTTRELTPVNALMTFESAVHTLWTPNLESTFPPGNISHSLPLDLVLLLQQPVIPHLFWFHRTRVRADFAEGMLFRSRHRGECSVDWR
jgi:hypothetical protein